MLNFYRYSPVFLSFQVGIENGKDWRDSVAMSDNYILQIRDLLTLLFISLDKKNLLWLKDQLL